MSIRGQCSRCGRKARLKDDLVGKEVVCSHCGGRVVTDSGELTLEPFAPPSAPAIDPASRISPPPTMPPRRKLHIPVALWFGLGALAIIGVATWMYWPSQTNGPTGTDEGANAPASTPAPVASPSARYVPAEATPVPQATARPAPPEASPKLEIKTAQTRSTPSPKPVPRRVEPVKPRLPIDPVAWTASPDAATTRYRWPTAGGDALAAMPRFLRELGSVRASSPFLAFDRIDDEFTGTEVWDLRSGKLVGKVKRNLALTAALSQDGQRIAIGSDVWSVSDGNKACAISEVVDLMSLSFLGFVNPRRVVVVSDEGGDSRATLVDITAAKSLAEFDVPGRPIGAISHGGRYLATLSSIPHSATGGKFTHTLGVYTLDQGRLVGRVHVKAPANCRASELAFSEDGRRLAALCSSPAGDSWLTILDASTGKTVASQSVGVMLEHKPFMWMPDSSGVIIGGRIYDSATARMVWSFDPPQQAAMAGAIGKLSRVAAVPGPDRFLLVRSDKTRRYAVRPVPVSKEQAAARAIVRSGGLWSEVLLPAAKAGDFQAVKTIKLPGRASNFVDAAELGDVVPSPKGVLGEKPVELDNVEPGGSCQFAFASPSAGRVALLRSGPQLGVFVDCYDLLSGKRVGTVPLPVERTLLDCSPEGRRALLGGPTRLDVCSFAAAAIDVSWAPYAKEKGSAQIAWAGFVDSTHVISIGKGGKLVMWSLPDCKAVYQVAGLRGVAALGGKRKTLACFDGQYVHLLEALTGKHLGTLEAPATAWPKDAIAEGIAFSPDGSRLAVIIAPRGPGEASTVAWWNTVTGKMLDRISIWRAASDEPAAPAGKTLAWRDSRVMSSRGELMDLDLAACVWRYTPSAAGQLDSPDGRSWFVRMPVIEKSPATLECAAVPDAQLRDLLAGGQIVYRRGDKVNLSVAGAAPAGDSNSVDPQVLDLVTQAVTRQGAVIDKDAQLQLAVTVQASDSGRTRQVDEGGKLVSRPIMDLKCTFVLSSAGSTLWSQSIAAQGDALDQALRELRLPQLVMAAGGRNTPLPGESSLELRQ